MAHSSWLPTSIVTDGGNYKFNLKITPQIQLPDALYRRVKAMAAAREISLAELVRNGLEYMLRVSAGAEADAASDGDRERVSFAVLYFRFR